MPEAGALGGHVDAGHHREQRGCRWRPGRGRCSRRPAAGRRRPWRCRPRGCRGSATVAAGEHLAHDLDPLGQREPLPQRAADDLVLEEAGEPEGGRVRADDGAVEVADDDDRVRRVEGDVGELALLGEPGEQLGALGRPRATAAGTSARRTPGRSARARRRSSGSMLSARAPTANGPPPRAVRNVVRMPTRQQLAGDHRGAEAQSRPDQQRQRQERERQHLLGPEHQQREPGEQQRLEHQLGAVAHGRRVRARPARAGRSPGSRPGARGSPSGRPRGRPRRSSATDRADADADGRGAEHAGRDQPEEVVAATPAGGSPGRPAQVGAGHDGLGRVGDAEQQRELDGAPGREVGQAAREDDSAASAGHHDRGLSTSSATETPARRPPGGDLAAVRGEVDRRDAADVDQRQEAASPRTARSSAGRHSCCAVCQPGRPDDAEAPDSVRGDRRGSGSTIRSQRRGEPGRIGSDSPVASNP